MWYYKVTETQLAKGRSGKMFNELEFRHEIAKKGKTLQDIATLLGISKVTLYRKINGESDFYRLEISKICEIIGTENMDKIFFAHKVT